MRLTKARIAGLFKELAARLLREGIEGEIGVVGGAAMVIAYDARISTKDVDAIFKPSEIIRKAAQSIAAENNLPENWLNDAVKGFMQRNPEKKIEVFSAPGLRVWIPEPEYLLAMKAISARMDTHDADDLRILMKKLNLKSSEEVFLIVEKYYPNKLIPPKTGFFIQELLQEPAVAKIHPRKTKSIRTSSSSSQKNSVS